MITMKMRNAVLVGLTLLSGIAMAQFDFGGGASGPSEPWKEFKLDARKRIKLDFRNANVDMVLALFSKESGITIVKDPALTGGMTITSAKPLPLSDAFEVLNANLKLRNFEMRKEGKLLVIRQVQRRDQGRSGGDFSSMMGGMTPEQMAAMFGGSGQLKVYPIEFANASQVARVINEVFAAQQNPMDQLMQMMMGGGGNTGGFGGGGTQGGRGGQTNQGRFGGMQGRFGGGFSRGGSQTVRASSDDFSNSVIVNAPDREQTQVAALIKQIDRETEQPLSPKVYKLEFATAAEIAPAIQNVLTANAPRGRGGMSAQSVPIEQRFQQAARFGSFQAAFGTVVTDPRTNSLIVTATDDNQKLVSTVIDELDVEIKFESTTFVFPLNNARADQIATLFNQAFGTRTGPGQFGQRTNTVGTRNPNQRTPTNNNRNTGGGRLGGQANADPGLSAEALELALEDPTQDQGLLETNIAVQQGGNFGQFFGGQGNRQGTTTTTTGRDAQGRLVPTRDLTNQITVIPDQNTNSLIVVTSPDNIELLRKILDQLDRIPEQVMIETIIVEATLDSSTKLGVEWQFSKDKAFNDPKLSNSGNTNFGVQNANPPREGFRYTLTGTDFSVFLNALKTDRRFSVLSTPRIFTSNNAEAQINISQRVPYVLSTREDPNGNLTFTYAFEDVGIVLTVTPRITSNGYVTMEINQTANDLQGFTDFNAPIINQRQADTTVSVKDGETIILGGIIRNQVSTTTKKIPILGDLPVLGSLFRSTDDANVKTELMVFLTPRVVKDEAQARKLREENEKQFSKSVRDRVNKSTPPPSTPSKSGGSSPKS